ncbi:ABC transporter permease [Paenibacillus sp. 32O-W]|mgnify:CR=1 FL=1|jgi:ABC-type sugar transport systems, permease components|uniref:carbohydrate ABC transporter permease n=1 Tax=Paenibacillus sp. 32O-W TaxID=1695218 RepID=UPI00072296E0|nr:sugar ABC transporter permease [Paenibacillus sp. 32O-W]ALS26585.1 ABC transporter permease [Paenibacillus sp. 32O-W]
MRKRFAAFKWNGWSRLTVTQKRDLYGWIFVSPFVLGFLLLFVGIFIDSFRFSFMEVNVLPQGGYTEKGVGLENYRQVLRVDPVFNRQLFDAVRNMLFDIPILVMYSLFIAVLLNQKMRGRAVLRAIFFVPVILATGIIDKADMSNSIMNAYQSIPALDTGTAMMEESSSGLLSNLQIKKYMLQMFDFSPALVDITVGAAENIYAVINHSGVQILIFLAGLQAISTSIYESARIEGCSGWECFWKITFPLISPLIFVNIIYSVVDSFTGGGNQVMNSITSAMKMGRYGTASAMAWVYFLVAAIFLLVIGFVASRFVFYQNRE